LEEFTFNHWNHFCVIFKALNRTSGEVAVTAKLFINGKTVKSGTPIIMIIIIRRKNVSNTLTHFCIILASKILEAGKYMPLKANGSLVVGQEQDDIGGFFDSTQSLSGRVTQFEIWSKAISSVDIQRIADCIQETVDIPEKVVKWTATDWTVKGNATATDIELSKLCTDSPLVNMVG
jgi:hypothetical protein